MVSEWEIQRNRSSHPKDLIIGLVASILLHSLLLVDANNWLQALNPESKRESQPVIIEFVEVPPSETKPPQQAKHRAAKDSTASGKVVSKPDSTAGMASPQAPKTSSSSINSPTVKSAQPKSAQSTAVLPLSPPKSQPKSGKIAAPNISQQPQSKKPAVVPSIIKSQPKLQTEIVKRLRARNPEPAIPQPQPQRQIAKQLQARNPEPAIPQPQPQRQIVKQLQAKNPEPAIPQPQPQRQIAKQLQAKNPEPATPQPQRDILKQLQAKNSEPPIPQPQPQRQIAKQLQAKNSEPPIPQPPIKPQITTVTPNIPIQTQPQKPAVVPNIPKTQTLPQKPAVVTTISKPKPLNPQENQDLPPKSSTEQLTTRINPTIPKPQPSPRQGNKNPLPSKSANEQLAARTARQTPSQPSSTSGAASRLGGPMSLSSRNLGGNYWAAPPNSNSSNPGAGGIDARREPEIGPYLEQLRQQVKQQWLPGITQQSRQSVVHFVVSRSGLMSHLQLVQPSGYRAIDEAALSAVKRAAPFAPLPPGYSQDNIRIRFTFNINVYGELELGTR